MEPITTDNYADAAMGLYWYCSDWHGGQNSVEYSIMSARLQYTPGASETGPDEMAQPFYDALEQGVITPEEMLQAIDKAYDQAHD